jgi:hypothetical protein
MASLVLSGDTSGSITVSAPAVAGSTTQTLVNVTGTLAPVVSGTAVTASSTSVDFTGIPSWAKRITVMLSGVSTNGTSNYLIQLGDSGGIENTGYSSRAITLTNNSGATSTAGLILSAIVLAANATSGSAIISLLDSSTNTWVVQGALMDPTNYLHTFSGVKSLSATLDRVRITAVNGTDTFDAGTINILFE